MGSILGLYAQQSKPAGKHFKSATSLIEAKKYREGIAELNKAWDDENQSSVKVKDSNFLIDVCLSMANCYDQSNSQDTAADWLLKGRKIALLKHDVLANARIRMQLNYVYHNATYNYYNFNLAKKMGVQRQGSEYQMWKIESIIGSSYKKLKGDSLKFYLFAGTNEGIFAGARCGFHTIVKNAETGRKFKYLGSGKIKSCGGLLSIGHVILDEDFDDSVYFTDGIYCESEMPETNKSSLFYQVTKLGYNLKPYENPGYYIHQNSSILDLSEFDENGIYELMLQELHASVKVLRDINYQYTDSVILGGHFKGRTIAQAMEQAELTDLKHMLSYTVNYPTYYYNRTDNILTAFIRWTYDNEAYAGGNENVIWKELLKVKPAESEAFIKKYRDYFFTSSTFDSTISSWIDTISSAGFAKQTELAKMMLDAAKFTQNKASEAFWLEMLTYQYHNAHNFSACYNTAKEWLKTGRNKENAFLELAVSANMDQKYNQAIEYSDSILLAENQIKQKFDSTRASDFIVHALVERGFGMLLNGKIKGSTSYLERAYQMDSSRRFNRFTYANSLALNGKQAEAQYQYLKCLEIMTSPVDIHYMFKDWSIFIENGNLVDFFTAEKKKMLALYEKNYKHKLIKDSLVNHAWSLRKYQGDLSGAFSNYIKALQVCEKYLPNDSIGKLFILEWLGYIAYEQHKDSISLIYNLQASQVAEKYHFSNDRILGDYDEVLRNCKAIARWDIYRQYTIKKTDLENRLLQANQKRLFVLSCGTNESTETVIKEKYAESDALRIIEALRNPSRLYYDSFISININGKGLTLDSLNHTLDRIIYQAGENDAFLFYYAGPTRADDLYAQLNLSNDYFMVSEVAGKISQLRCKKQIMVLDGGNVAVDSLNNYLKDFSSTYNTKSSCFITNKTWRQETENGHGLLTEGILHYFEDDKTDKNISAQSLIQISSSYMISKTTGLGIQAISQGQEIMLGKIKKRNIGVDKIKPVINLPNAFIVRGGDNIRVGVSDQNAVTGFVYDNVGVFRFMVNGVKIPFGNNGRFTIPMSRITSDTLNLYAEDSARNDTNITVVINRNRQQNFGSGKKIAWFFATDSFDSPAWHDLHNPVFDATELSEVMHDYYGYEVHFALNKDLEGMMKTLDEMKEYRYSPTDQVFIYFAGHGYNHPSRGFFVVPSDAEDPAGGKFRNYLSGSILVQEYVKKIPCNNVFLTMDLCYAGSIRKNSDVIEYLQPVDRAGMKVEAFIRKQQDIKCVQFLTSGRSNVVLEGALGSHSPFAQALILNFKNGVDSAKISYLTLRDLAHGLPQTGVTADWRPDYGYLKCDAYGEYLFEIKRRTASSGESAGAVSVVTP